MYPATVVFVVMPFAWMREPDAACAFAALSSFVMVMAITRKSLHLLPMLASLPLNSSATLGQWSLLLTAAMYYPVLGFLAAVKPQAGVPVLAAGRDRKALVWAAGIAIALLIASLALIPRWPQEWVDILSNQENTARYVSPVSSYGGFLLPLALLRWRRREAWLLLGMSLFPQSFSFYFLLPLFTIPRNFAESVFLLVISTAGMYIGATLTSNTMTPVEFFHWSSSVAVLSTYLPCLALRLIRENVSGPSPRLTRIGRALLS